MIGRGIQILRPIVCFLGIFLTFINAYNEHYIISICISFFFVIKIVTYSFARQELHFFPKPNSRNKALVSFVRDIQAVFQATKPLHCIVYTNFLSSFLYNAIIFYLQIYSSVKLVCGQGRYLFCYGPIPVFCTTPETDSVSKNVNLYGYLLLSGIDVCCFFYIGFIGLEGIQLAKYTGCVYLNKTVEYFAYLVCYRETVLQGIYICKHQC